MPREFPRARRVGEQIQRELAELVRDELGDPRVKGITITGVDCANDLSHAKVHFSMLLVMEWQRCYFKRTFVWANQW